MFLILPALCSLVNPVRAQVRDVSVVIAADTHFDMPPESDQFYHVKAMNRLPGTFVWPAGGPQAFAGDTLKQLNGV